MSSTEPQPAVPDDTDDEVVTILPTTVRVRRAPKFGAFILVGAVLGFIVTLVLTALFPLSHGSGESFGQLLAYFSLYGIPIGGVLGALLAILLDRLSARRAREASAEITTVEAGPVTGDLEP